jgi:hypothetical protein
VGRCRASSCIGKDFGGLCFFVGMVEKGLSTGPLDS